MARAKLAKVPAAIRDRVHQLILDGRSVDDILEHLHGLSVDISRASVGRYSKTYRAMADRLRETREVAGALVSEIGAVSEDQTPQLLVSLLHSIIFRVLHPLTAGEQVNVTAEEAMMWSAALKNAATASKTSVDRDIKLREAIAAEVKAKAVDQISTAAKAEGWDEAFVQKARKLVLGVSI